MSNRYKEPGLAEVLCRVPNTPEAIAKLRNLEVKLRHEGHWYKLVPPTTQQPEILEFDTGEKIRVLPTGENDGN